MQTLWNWLNGNKTIFGMVILSIAQSIPADTEVIGIPLVPVLNWLGGILTGAGVVHKMAKATTTPEPNQ